MPLNPNATDYVPLAQQIERRRKQLGDTNCSIAELANIICNMELTQMSNYHMALIGVPMNKEDDYSSLIRKANCNLEGHKENKKKLESMISSLRLQNNIIMAISEAQLRLILTGQIRICVNII